MYAYFANLAFVILLLPSAAAFIVSSQPPKIAESERTNTVIAQHDRRDNVTSESFVSSVAWSPDGKTLAIGGTDKIWLYTADIQPIKYLASQLNSINALAWSPNGRELAAGGDSTIIEVWDIKSDLIISSFSEHTSAILAIAWRPNSDLIASASLDRTIRVWDTNTGKQVKLLQDWLIESLSWSKDGQRLLLTGRPDMQKPGIYIVSVSSGRLLFSLPDQETTTFFERKKPITSVAAWNPDNLEIAIGYFGIPGDKAVKILVLNTRHVTSEFQLLESEGSILSLVWSPDGSKLATESNDAVLHIWNPDSGRELISYPGSSVNFWASYPNILSWSPNGHFLANVTDRNIVRVIDVQTFHVRSVSISDCPTCF